MPIQKVKIPAGINRETTRYAGEGGWWDMDKVRFRSGAPEKIGGWVRLGATTTIGHCKFLHCWATLVGDIIMAVATSKKLYIEYKGTLYDITPIRKTASVDNPFTTTASSSVVTCTVPVHRCSTGDRVHITGAVDTDGIFGVTLNAEHVVTVTGADTFTITVTNASSGLTGGGTGVLFKFEINNGYDTATLAVGFGVSGYDVGVWGLPRAAGTADNLYLQPSIWTGSNFGQDLICCNRGGTLYHWSPTSLLSSGLATRATILVEDPAVVNAPLLSDGVFITDDRHVVSYGSTLAGSGSPDHMLIRWCAQSNFDDWTPSIENTAGDYRLTTGSLIYAVKQMRQENLIWTDTALVSMQFVGPPVVFSFTLLAANTTIASPNAVIVVSNIAYWMGKEKFYMYNGQVQLLPCAVQHYIYSDLNLTQMSQIHAANNSQFNEVTWFYCGLGSDTVNKYVTYNYLEQVWSYGTMPRTAWIDSPLRTFPIALGVDNKMYYHETGVDADTGVPMSAFIESTDFDIGDGQMFSFVTRIIPDIDFDISTANPASVVITLKSRYTPSSPTYTQTSAATVTKNTTEESWVRIRGRQLVMRIESTLLGVTWQVGDIRLDMREDGQR